MFTRKTILVLFALVYAAGAVLSARNIIVHTQASTGAIDGILKTYSLKNEGAQTLESFKEKHPFLGMFVSSPIKHALGLSSAGESEEALNSEVTHFLKTVREESSVAAWWSWFLVSFSLFYVVTVVAVERRIPTRSVLFALTAVSLTFFVVGVIAPAMVVWTAPAIPMETGRLNFVVQHQVRGIAAIIWELLTTGHAVIGFFLLLFSIVTPLTKASLTFFVTASSSKALNFRIGQVLHSIGKWSMADVFVAAILLALYALKAQEATKSIPCLGLYYFIGYCLLSLSTSELLVHSGVVSGNEDKKSEKRLGPAIISGFYVGVVCFILALSLYTYQQYTKNIEQRIRAATAPEKLDSSDLVMPVHK